MEEKVKIVFENDDFLVVEKPAGIVTTKEGKDDNTLEDWLREVRLNNLPRNGIIHRLDKGTSGLLLVAKNEKAFLNFKKQFKERTVTKKYYCLVCGESVMEGSIDLPISRSNYGFGKFGVNPDGKKALTKFKVIKKFELEGKIVSLVDIDLFTGRTHQIRVHFSYLSWPIVGDKLYGSKIGGRIRLHCRLIGFDDYIFESHYEEK